MTNDREEKLHRENVIVGEAMFYIKKYIDEVVRNQLKSKVMTDEIDIKETILLYVKEVVEDSYLGEDRIREICQEEINDYDFDDKIREIASEEVESINVEALLDGTSVRISFG